MQRGQMVSCLYVALPGALLVASYMSGIDMLYAAGIVLALPLSYVANVAAYVVAASTLPLSSPYGVYIAAALVSRAALTQLLVARALRADGRARRRRIPPSA